MQVNGRRGEIVVSTVLFAIAAFFLWGAWRMPAGSVALPGPGIVPLIASAMLAATALALLVRALLAKGADAAARTGMRPGPVAIVFAALTGVAAAFEYAGFVVTLSVFLFVMLRVFSPLSTLRSAVAAVAISAAASWAFGTLLGVALPHW